MTCHMTIHGAHVIRAEAGGTFGAPLAISAYEEGGRASSATLFTDDHALSRKLADAINETVAAHRAEKLALAEQKECTDA